jgi:hypothetical protein
MQNSYIYSFNGKFRNQRIKKHWPQELAHTLKNISH